MKYLAVFTDIHGCLDEFKKLIEQVEEHMKDKPFTYLFLGDYIDRGPDHQGVVDLVRKLQEEKGAIALKGNHEDMAVNAFYAAQPNYDPSYVPFHDDILWMKELPVKFETGKHFFCHAGIYPGVALEDQDPRHLIWIRDLFLSSPKKHPKYIVHGHTPTNAWDDEYINPSVLHNRCNLDTGKVFGGQLSCAIFDVDIEKPIHIISV